MNAGAPFRVLTGAFVLLLMILVCTAGVVCDAQCTLLSFSSHSCCPGQSAVRHADMDMAAGGTCSHKSHAESAAIESQVIFAVAFVSLSLPEPVTFQATTETGFVVASSSPPKFNLRI